MSEFPDTVSYLVIVDSRDRDFKLFPKPNSYTIQLPTVYKNVINVNLRSIEVPTSFYVFHENFSNTSLRVNIYDAGGTTLESTALVKIPNGNYSVYTMESSLVTALNAAFSPLTFVAQVNRTTGGMYIKNVEGRVVEIDTTVDVLDKETDWGLAYFLGFEKNTTYRGNAVQAPNIVSLLPFTYILMDIDEVNSMDECNMYGEPGGYIKNAFAKIPISVTSFDYVFRDEKCCVYNRSSLNPPIGKLTKLTVNWRFHDGKIIDFNGVEHSFAIEIVCESPDRIPIKNMKALYNLSLEQKSVEKMIGESAESVRLDTL